jgi:hypothetical protein
VLLQAGRAVPLLARVVEELLDRCAVGGDLAGDFAERVVIDVLAEDAVGINDVANRDRSSARKQYVWQRKLSVSEIT